MKLTLTALALGLHRHIIATRIILAITGVYLEAHGLFICFRWVFGKSNSIKPALIGLSMHAAAVATSGAFGWWMAESAVGK